MLGFDLDLILCWVVYGGYLRVEFVFGCWCVMVGCDVFCMSLLGFWFV